MKALPLWVKLLGGITLLVGVCVAVAFIPTDDVAYAPVEPIDLDGRITVNGERVEPLQGRLYFVGVAERRVNLLQRALLDIGDPNVDFGTRAKDAPAGGGPSEADTESMNQAKRVAAAVAYEAAGKPVGWSGTSATVAAVAPGTPAGARLQPGDIILRIDDTDVDNGVDASKLVNARPPGSKVTIALLRAGDRREYILRTIAPEPGTADPSIKSRLGMQLDTVGLRIALPNGDEVGIDSDEVVGPSAALPFALYLYDSVAAGNTDLLRGRHVVATGALSPSGAVLPVGRIRQKATSVQLANRDLFVVPVANAEEARAAVAAQCGEGARCARVVPVASINEAIELLQLDDAALDARLQGASP